MKISIEEIDIKSLKPTNNNPRQIKKDDFEILKRSLKEFPEMQDLREIVVDENYTILGGHQRVKAMLANGQTTAKVKVATGLTEAQKREFIIKDNIANGEWDFDVLANEWDDEPLDEWGLAIKGVNGKELAKTLMGVEIPIYEPSKEKPEIDKLIDKSEYETLIGKIDKSKCSEDLKELLKIRASFFVDFDFQKIADYYAHSDNDTKEIMEDLGLVILTPKKALEKGIIELRDTLGFDSEEEW